VLTRADAAQQRTLTTEDVLPAAEGDAGGLSALYLAVGWVVGGNLVASIIGVSSGSRPLTRARGGVRRAAGLRRRGLHHGPAGVDRAGPGWRSCCWSTEPDVATADPAAVPA
jgi:hypothetical protein